MTYSKKTIEIGTKGPVIIEYRYDGDMIAGWYLKCFIGGKQVSTRGTPSSGGRKKFKRLTAKMLRGYSAL